jgi:hypothetical protein
VTVQTTGVNWESVGVIIAAISVIVTVMLWIFARQDKRREHTAIELRDDMRHALDHLSDVLTAKLETKDTVARISERLARVEAVMGISGPGRD